MINEEVLKSIKNDLKRFFNSGSMSPEESFLELENSLNRTMENDLIRNHLVLTLAKSRNLWKWIDKTYAENEDEYYKCYLKTFFKDTYLTEGFSVNTKEYINKLAGIDWWCRENDTNEPLFKLIQKEYKKLYSRFKLGIDSLDLDSFLSTSINSTMKKNEKKYSKKSNISERFEIYQGVVVVAIFLSSCYNVRLEGFLYKKLLDMYMGGCFENIKAKLQVYMNTEEIGDKNLEELASRVLELDYKVLIGCSNLRTFYDAILSEQSVIAQKTAQIMSNSTFEGLDSIESKIAEKFLSGDINPFVDSEELVAEYLDERAQDFLETTQTTALSGVVCRLISASTMHGLEKDFLEDVRINADIIRTSVLVSMGDELEKYMKHTSFDSNIKYKFLSSLTIIALYDSLKTIAPNNFSTQRQADFEEIENLKKELAEKERQYVQLEEKFSNFAENKKSEIKDILKELDLEKKKNKRLTQELEKTKEEKMELVAMREFVYSKELNESGEIACTLECPQITTDEKIEYLRTKKISVFGGHPNWTSKLKDLLPNAKYVSPDAFSSRKFNNLGRFDMLVICPLFASHGMSYKVSEAIKGSKTKKVLIVDDINTDFIIDKMYKKAISLEEVD